MKYMGGKSRLAKAISEVILAESPSRTFYLEPFVGGGSTFAALAPHFDWSVAGDLHPDLILMWNAVLFEGWEPPMEISEERWRELRSAPPSAVRGFAGFCTSWGGRFFQGYARGGTQNYAASGARSTLRKRDAMLAGNTLGVFRNQGYADWVPASGTTVYCDPPYAGTKEYTTTAFDHEKFWGVMDEWAGRGCHVFVSEYAAPEHWRSVWSVDRKVGMDNVNGRKITATEHLFTRGKDE
jgi:DNA adenine methylase